MNLSISKFLPTFCAGLALATGTLYQSSTAQACDCMPLDITQSYSNAAGVFSGQILFGIELANTKLYLAWILETYKGCAPKGQILWLQTDASAAACGARFTQGGQYLIHTGPGTGPFAFTQTTHSCAGNRPLDQLTASDQEFLNSRNNCCGDECSCTGGQPIVNCLADPCEVTKPCKGEGAVRCQPNYCGGCTAEFYNSDGKQVCLDPKDPRACTRDQDCDESQYCGLKGTCAKDSTCSTNAECNLPGNAYDVFVDCAGYGVCNAENKCEFFCGDEACIDHSGYDFGQCEMVVGWVRKGEECVFINSGCGSLIPSRPDLSFTSKQDCETRCGLPSTTFPCGDKLQCDKTTSFCVESIPGARPKPGQPTRNFNCIPLNPNCKNNPSCESCFTLNKNNTITEGDYSTGTCSSSKQGSLTVNIAYP